MSKFNRLSRNEMKSVLGGLVDPGSGGSNCYVTVYGPNYTNPQQIPTNTTSPSQAEARCVLLISEPGNGVNHCKYNCSGATNPS